MLSYRHGYHAGNFADVLKHMVLVSLLDYMVRKPKPMLLLDTHAGAGLYDLTHEYAQKTGEHAEGIGRLWGRDAAPVAVARYLEQVAQANAGNTLRCYPGSAWLMYQAMRDEDRLALCELHGSDAGLLTANVGKHRRLTIERGDGLAKLKALLPPPEHRGLIFIDPSYELREDTAAIVDSVIDAWRRFATGVFVLWLPVIHRPTAKWMEKQLQAAGIKRMQLFELNVRTDQIDRGMTGSAVIVINPPYTLMQEMQDALPWLADVLGNQQQGSWRCVTLAGEQV